MSKNTKNLGPGEFDLLDNLAEEGCVEFFDDTPAIAELLYRGYIARDGDSARVRKAGAYYLTEVGENAWLEAVEAIEQ